MEAVYTGMETVDAQVGGVTCVGAGTGEVSMVGFLLGVAGGYTGYGSEDQGKGTAREA